MDHGDVDGKLWLHSTWAKSKKERKKERGSQGKGARFECGTRLARESRRAGGWVGGSRGVAAGVCAPLGAGSATVAGLASFLRGHLEGHSELALDRQGPCSRGHYPDRGKLARAGGDDDKARQEKARQGGKTARAG